MLPKNNTPNRICQQCGKPFYVAAYIINRGEGKNCSKICNGRSTKKHGLSKTPVYNAWQSMRARCNNPNIKRYEDYGGRGIKVCKRWDEFSKFLEDMGDRPSANHSIDRIDNNGNYTPKNCRWSLPKAQSRNRRNNVKLSAFGVTRIIAEWSEILGIAAHVICSRISHGWEPERALSVPVRNNTTLLTHNGKTQSVSDWANDMGIPMYVISNRRSRGWSVDKAISTPLSHTKKRTSPVEES